MDQDPSSAVSPEAVFEDIKAMAVVSGPSIDPSYHARVRESRLNALNAQIRPGQPAPPYYQAVRNMIEDEFRESFETQQAHRQAETARSVYPDPTDIFSSSSTPWDLRPAPVALYQPPAPSFLPDLPPQPTRRPLQPHLNDPALQFTERNPEVLQAIYATDPQFDDVGDGSNVPEAIGGENPPRTPSRARSGNQNPSDSTYLGFTGDRLDQISLFTGLAWSALYGHDEDGVSDYIRAVAAINGAVGAQLAQRMADEASRRAEEAARLRDSVRANLNSIQQTLGKRKADASLDESRASRAIRRSSTKGNELDDDELSPTAGAKPVKSPARKGSQKGANPFDPDKFSAYWEHFKNGRRRAAAEAWSPMPEKFPARRGGNPGIKEQDLKGRTPVANELKVDGAQYFFKCPKKGCNVGIKNKADFHSHMTWGHGHRLQHEDGTWTGHTTTSIDLNNLRWTGSCHVANDRMEISGPLERRGQDQVQRPAAARSAGRRGSTAEGESGEASGEASDQDEGKGKGKEKEM